MHANCRIQIKCDRCHSSAFPTVTALTKHKRFCTESSTSKGNIHHPYSNSNHSGGSLSSPNSIRSHNKPSSTVSEAFSSTSIFSNPSAGASAFNPLYQPFFNQLFENASGNCFSNSTTNYQQLLAEQLNKLTSSAESVTKAEKSAKPSDKIVSPVKEEKVVSSPQVLLLNIDNCFYH